VKKNDCELIFRDSRNASIFLPQIDPSVSVFFNQIDLPGIPTTHDLIYWSYSLPSCPDPGDLPKFFRDYKNIDTEALLNDVSDLVCSNFFSADDVNVKLQIFTSFIMSLHCKIFLLQICNCSSQNYQFYYKCTFRLNRNHQNCILHFLETKLRVICITFQFFQTIMYEKCFIRSQTYEK
jgi:hypothetical protein